MHLLCIGINHHTADLNVREDLSYSEDEIRTTLRRWREKPQDPNAELVILSTCNRSEIYGAFPTLSFKPLENLLLSERAKDSDAFRPYLYTFTDNQVVHHLMRVASGLDSQVLGETQILGQVQRALDIALTENSVSGLLIRLFQSAIHAGKRVHSETKINQKPVSVASLAVDLSLKDIDPQNASVLVLGAGEMAERALEALHLHQVFEVIIINRTLERAQQLAERWGYQYQTLEKLNDALWKADLVLSALNVQQIILKYEQIKQIMRMRNGKAIRLVDLGLPRNIDAQVAHLPGVIFWNLDQLSPSMETFQRQRQTELAQAEKILDEEEARFLKYLKRQSITPLLSEIHQHAEQVRMEELEKTLRRLPGLNEQQQRRIEAFSEALVKKILAYPFVQVLTAVENLPAQPNSENIQEIAQDLVVQSLPPAKENRITSPSIITVQWERDSQP
ncbi:MAG: glutamyl-tRNA reductase [Anaerolineales bacterium]